MESNTFITYNASNTTDATNKTTKRQKQEVQRQSRQIIGQSELKTKKINLRNYRVLKLTSGNTAKWWKMRQKIYATIKAKKLAKATI